MKVQLETITNKVNRSFSIIFDPRLNDLFFWHFHPEYELVYIEGADGPRHVGNHISNYQGSDLVLIGSNIPHLNFDYGVKTGYRKVVVHLKKELVETNFHKTPELILINTMFQKSKHGLVFKGKLKKELGVKLFALKGLEPTEQYLQLLEILRELSNSEKTELLHNRPYDNQVSDKDQKRISAIFAHIDNNYHHKIKLQDMAVLSHMTKEGFCRYFKKRTKYTFTEFLNRYRISQSKRDLMTGKSVSDACFASGFESLSYFNRIFKRITNENPREFRKKYA
ncbi:transcriptional regulator, AraC family [Psychroflexus torquis ATCC 700755]|uniref:Transcriptional regulator, AraC family n=1 Tax=Psychroflexus torquis (strain ATCC 700755 / CIP 106069 / ACAM 623) TaxID=313595 RepID=K4IGA1_PSYTT|nr:AraC family transcriptional regulator [Psychroflexus torquis]AFU69522.1 transcriptional regulator, AraC family [Psychroflexus torquis ATCC 700755]